MIDYQTLLTAIATRNPINTSPIKDRDCIGIVCANTTTLNTLYYNILVTLAYAVSIIAVLTLIYAGISYMTAGGDTEKAEKAKKMIIGSIIGILIIISAYTIFKTSVNVVTARPGSDMSDVLDQP